ncbi:hypothetical protein NP493_665g01024 [Ridgeia piscesae]|uniref:DUF4832 domain-containing protein n=1 Tax=Ridgeia piscesae TaxID=27915 RepID=A0AAD9KRL9_RIDPI|nr:hypothetical protein NP493_665g01024 [Ridgeia piscesae]
MPADGQSPYGDATKDQILTHIDQLAPIFRDYDDVIDVVQVGFIGVWGDWYYTTYFGPPEDRVFQSPNIDGLTPQQWQDRKDVLTAHLDNLPETIAVSVRTPRFKTVLYNEDATTEAERTGRTDKGRVGHHNNAFVTSSTDSGTYQCKLTEYRYLRVDTQHVPIGGESYAKSYNEPLDRYKCPTATREMRQLHYSYFNLDSSTDVLNSWRADGCFDGIRLSLGYRLVLKQAVLPVNAEQGGKFCFRLELENVGYAAPYKAKTLNIMLRNKSSGQLYSVEMDDDLMGWLPGKTIVIDNAANMPVDIPAGTYEMLLAIKDKVAPQFSDYNILLANDGVPEPRKGLNNLKHDLVVGDTGAAADDACSYLVTVATQPDSNYTRVHDFTPSVR